MKTVRIAAIVILVFTLASLQLDCSVVGDYVQKPTLQVQEVKYHAVSLQEGRLDSRIQVHNPNPFQIPVRNVLYSLKLNERELVNSSLNFDRNIPANGSIRLQVPIHFQYQEILNSVGSIIQNRAVNFNLTGEVDFGVIAIPFSKSGSFTLR